MKRYKVSRNLDTEVSYFVTNTDNARHDAWEGEDVDLMDALEERYTKLLELEADIARGNDGCFTVSSKNYLLAVECRDMYRMRHDTGILNHRLLSGII